MSAYSQYQLLEEVPGGTAKSFKARHLVTGESLMVHLLVGQSAGLERQLENLPREKRDQIVDRGSNDGTYYVVTTPLPTGVSFDDWVIQSTRVRDVGSRAGKWDITRIHAPVPATVAPSP